MPTGTIILIVSIVIILIIAYVACLIIRKRNDNLLVALEERKEDLFNLPVNEEVETVKALHLIGQSQVSFREWNQKWVDLSLSSFADIENHIFEAESYNNSFRFVSAKNAIDSIESQIDLIEEDISSIRRGLIELREQEEKNSGRVKHALNLFDNLQAAVRENSESYGETLPELEKQLKNIEVEFSEFVMLNSSGDPIEAAEILDKTEEHMIALNQIMDRIPDLIEKVTKNFPEQLEDLESGYRKLVEQNYLFTEANIESQFQNIRVSIRENTALIVSFDLDAAEAENEAIQAKIDHLYRIFNREIDANKAVVRISKNLPKFLEHAVQNTQLLDEESQRLNALYLLADSKLSRIEQLKKRLETIEIVVAESVEDLENPQVAYSILEERLEHSLASLKEIEEEQLVLADYLKSQEVSESTARKKATLYINKLHTLKRYMEKRNLPGIPAEFLTSFFRTSDHVETLIAELDYKRINTEVVNRLLENATYDMNQLEELAYLIVQNATLTEQLLQYSNRYRSFDESVQKAFNRSLSIFEKEFDYQAAFEEISFALETVEPGVTERFVRSYEKTREAIRY
ncbi:septation ring formation regulator EzrA [Streptococcus ruminantium]|uniref:Septation ring formation regulator EzrA n=1 Tax=Streptococcus ruminantium TaxID=1917441 RepID=A0ABU1B285_9STRE|nr:septation ring formation regulator EzrA [Streptococcus ruminantium]MDQ8759445.1 septation ring formation regulator EzrA [Streptococcus ruminantium]MDQ8768864.1 septation ring formation regulator EzrA [Streptococcus ruminantium]MDQ8793502.1 septation ring formation regulator EzrA [Streptococcus ruminantium]MDQ8795999.1 septation ring formation regulator EzrA [Streptococcus ruminantium]MDQ8805354.1 septation ring formation regulator EzrA [Streptococcus ruminantium]